MKSCKLVATRRNMSVVAAIATYDPNTEMDGAFMTNQKARAALADMLACELEKNR